MLGLNNEKKKSTKSLSECEGLVDGDDDDDDESEKFFFNKAKRKSGISILREGDFGFGIFWLNPQIMFTLACLGSKEDKQEEEE